jgi:hypothetical protein
VLFMDIVGYSKLPMDRQEAVLRTLQAVVSASLEFLQAQANQEMIRLPTGDGMALVFFGDAEAAMRCALEVSRALKSHPEIPLRMGLHKRPCLPGKFAALTIAIASLVLLPSSAKADTFVYNVTLTRSIGLPQDVQTTSTSLAVAGSPTLRAWMASEPPSPYRFILYDRLSRRPPKNHRSSLGAEQRWNSRSSSLSMASGGRRVGSTIPQNAGFVSNRVSNKSGRSTRFAEKLLSQLSHE